MRSGFSKAFQSFFNVSPISLEINGFYEDIMSSIPEFKIVILFDRRIKQNAGRFTSFRNVLARESLNRSRKSFD